MENELLSIGRLASLSGLTVSALRFYDGAQLLVPAVVDRFTGYRYYRPDQVGSARLIAHLRRISLPLAEIRAILVQPGAAAPILADQLARLEAGLADARREISIITRLLEDSEIPMTRFTLSAADLIAALNDVRFAVGIDPELPMLHGVFFETETEGDRLRLVATDRYRLATSTIANPGGADVALLLPTDAVDQLLAGPGTGELTVVVENGAISMSGPGCTVRAELPDVDFPSYRPALERAGQPVPFDAAALRIALASADTEPRTRDSDGTPYQLSRISVTSAGVSVGDSDDPNATVIGLNREFLLQALALGDQLTLGLDGPIAPLAIRNPDRDHAFSILMPVRLDQPA